MTGRKPPGVPVETWVERQIREAQERGSFDGLPGTGKPIEGLGQPRHELAWVAEKVHREQLPVGGILPPSLALAKEVEDLPERLARERSERKVRELVEDLDVRIRAAVRGPQVGPPLRVGVQDVEAHVARWRASR
ncbi:uncharacterized protein DUF1992 [Motilibacter peucedani]|uniref:Uncharacterized protein DUF1992 n=1 Tax=Motilibacter peucedani TaxID=598650 RepID=A0A420XRD2_9ACTN|nr:DUF1992 domain-containing protein [Motilibacter peucedani]RKS77463.1 uncharacterized protein DUF1992 [Motilibacter peucedani]